MKYNLHKDGEYAVQCNERGQWVTAEFDSPESATIWAYTNLGDAEDWEVVEA